MFAIYSLSYDRASQLLSPIAKAQPAVASTLVTEAIKYWCDESDEAPLPTLAELGFRIRNAMDAWVNGIGSLARLIGPVKPHGITCPLGLSINGRRVTMGWFNGGEVIPEVSELPASARTLGQSDSNWQKISSTQVGPQPSWPWRDTYEHLN